MNNDILQIRIPKHLKADAESIFVDLGLKLSDAVRLFLQQTVNSHRLPFQPSPRTPNAKTIAAMRDAEEGRVETVTLEQLRAEFKRLQKR